MPRFFKSVSTRQQSIKRFGLCVALSQCAANDVMRKLKARTRGAPDHIRTNRDSAQQSLLVSSVPTKDKIRKKKSTIITQLRLDADWPLTHDSTVAAQIGTSSIIGPSNRTHSQTMINRLRFFN